MQSICSGRMGGSARGRAKGEVVSCRQPGSKHQEAWVRTGTPAAGSPAVKQGEITAQMTLNLGAPCHSLLSCAGPELDPGCGQGQAFGKRVSAYLEGRPTSDELRDL